VWSDDEFVLDRTVDVHITTGSEKSWVNIRPSLSIVQVLDITLTWKQKENHEI